LFNNLVGVAAPTGANASQAEAYNFYRTNEVPYDQTNNAIAALGKVDWNINDAMKKGELFCTFHSAEIFLNHITSPVRDRFVLAPEFKVTAVRIEKTTL